ncbi:MAG: aldehyde dehydrogenase (NADP(+)) [Pseudomonadota bacterium]
MVVELTGKNLVAGDWVEAAGSFTSEPVSGAPRAFSQGNVALVDRAAKAAEDAFGIYAATSREDRAIFLNQIADEIENRGAAITEIGTEETGLPAARLDGERGRTTGQLRMFANHILAGDYLDRRHDEALPDRAPLPRPDLRLIQRPIGPVAVFGASNFPLAFSTAGGDTAAALAAGCPVIVKAHPAHPGTGEIVADAIRAAAAATDQPMGVFSFIHDAGHEIGAALVQHPLITAVGFTGSLRAGRALFDLCAARPVPIPFYGELGAINPMFVLPDALAARAADIANCWAASLTMGAGQFCTNPGVAFVTDGAGAETFAEAATEALAGVNEQVMLSANIAQSFAEGRDRLAATPGVETLLERDSGARAANPNLLATTAETWFARSDLAEEVFGPLGILVRLSDPAQYLQAANGLEGQLTCTLHLDDGDLELAQDLMPVLERKAGRILANGYPTGVEVCDAMVHGGPYPASTNFGATSVGSMAIRRFLRPVSYQNMPEGLLPRDLT